jgi:hypothetical protein
MTDQGGGSFGKSERVSGRLEVKFFGVVDVVETECQDDAREDGREEDDGVFGDKAAIVETESGVFGDGVVVGAGIGDAGVFHDRTPETHELAADGRR